MGQEFANLTKTGVFNPSSGQTQFGGPQQLPGLLSQAAASGAQPASADLGDSGVNFNQPPAQNPQTIHPSFQQAASLGATPGGGNAMSPALTKGGKLLTLLTSGLQGALAGHAASEQAILESGGRRAGGAGMGFQAGYTLPWQRAQQLAQTQVAVGGAQPVQTPYGQMPAAIASKILMPYLGYQGKIGAAQIGAGGREAAAQTAAGATTQAAQTRAGATIKAAQINQGMAIPVDETVANLAGFPELAGQGVGKATWTNINKALEAKGYHTQDMGTNGTGPNDGMWLLDKAGNRIKQISPNSLTFQRGASFAQNRPEVVVNPENPGEAYFTTAAQAMTQHLQSPQGAATQAAKAEARSEVPTKVGDQKVAFNTAIAHAGLLQQAAQALNNGDQQTLSSLKNRFKNEFGATGPVTAEAIADAYTREVTKMLSAGHLTDSEISTVGKTLNPSRQSLQQVLGVISAYKALSQSKLQQLNNQVQSIRQPNASKQGAAKDSLGIR